MVTGSTVVIEILYTFAKPFMLNVSLSSLHVYCNLENYQILF